MQAFVQARPSMNGASMGEANAARAKPVAAEGRARLRLTNRRPNAIMNPMLWLPVSLGIAVILAVVVVGALAILLVRDTRRGERHLREQNAFIAHQTHAYLRRMDRQIAEAQSARMKIAEQTRRSIRTEHRLTRRLLDLMDRRHRDTDTLIRMLLERSDRDRPPGHPA